MRTTWSELIKEEFDNTGDTWEDIVTTLTDEELCTEFNADFGHHQGIPFTAWSQDWVYFPIKYDGAEWVGSAPRNPCTKKTEHQGGG